MAAWALRRLGAAVLLVWLVATATFVLVSAAPGDLTSRIYDGRIPPEARTRWRQEFGLDQPLPARYAAWLGAALRGDLGTSWTSFRPVTAVIAERLPATLLLTSLGLALELGGGVLLALIQLRRPHGPGDHALTLTSLVAYGVPTFIVALVLLDLLSYRLPLFPPSHLHSAAGESAAGWSRLVDLARHLALPVLTIGITGIGGVARYVRGSLMDERTQTYVLAARARGLSARRALWSHALPNALLPLITMVGLSLPFLFSGSLVIEVIFSWPGMGRLMYEAALARDLPVLLGGTIMATAAVVAGNFLADVLYAAVDPRVRR